MEPNSAAPLREMWYYAFPSKRLRPGKSLARVFLGEPLLFARRDDGRVFALRDICPHRGVPLHAGRFDGGEIECPFHGWRFDSSGGCTAIPSRVAGDAFDPGRVRVKSYRVQETHGNIWVFFGEQPETAAEVPALPEVEPQRRPDLTLSMRMPCAIDEAVFGLMDPTHNPFVHVSWWWRRPGSIRDKEKAFAPAPYGFTMLPHRPSGSMLPYKLLGGAPQTQIIFRLPSTRIEHARFGRHQFVALSTVTPTVDNEIEMSYCAYWTTPLFTAIKPIVYLALRTFALQDRDTLALQSGGLKYNPALLLIDDADTQAKWYHRLKNEYARASAAKRPFVNPVRERVLRFRS
ncbi:MAG TPA: Rieske 2Fe-2S domain-containing protein [Stellaceae bacterium]|nr:Rieske 2Fe-2S domain-containing protein [Stellaceae bacterium]